MPVRGPEDEKPALGHVRSVSDNRFAPTNRGLAVALF